jgi:hypothetical protein
MAKRKVSAESASLRAAQNVVRGASGAAAITNARPYLAIDQIHDFVAWLPSVRHRGQALDLGLFPSSVAALWARGTFKDIGLAREIRWAGEWIARHATALSTFRGQVVEYETFLARSDFDQCARVLGKIEDEFGSSLWLIETKTALIQASEGLEAQKAFATSVLDSKQGNHLVSWLTHCVSRRNETTTTPGRFVRDIEWMVSGWTEQPDMALYAKYRLTGWRPETIQDFNAVLRLEGSAALVDIFDTFVRLAGWASVSEDQRVKSAFRAETLNLAELVDDERLRRSAFAQTADARWLSKSRLPNPEAVEALLLGQYQLAFDHAERGIDEDPCDTELWLIAAAAIASSDIVLPEKAGFCWTIVASLASLHDSVQESDGATIKLFKHCLNNRLLGFASIITGETWGGISSNPDAGINQHSFFEGEYLRYAAISGLDTLETKRNLARFFLGFIQSPALAYQIVQAGLEDDFSTEWPDLKVHLPLEVAQEADAWRAFNEKNHAEVFRRAQLLTTSSDKMRARRAERFSAQALLQEDRITELVAYVASACIENPDIVNMLPLDECATRLDRSLRRELAAQIAVPIVLDLYSKRFDQALDDVRAYSYEDFLIAHGVDKPSEIADQTDKFDRSFLVHYLRYICVPEIMQVSSAFQGTRELEDDRKKVLSQLVKIDPTNSEIYETELRDITRAQLIHRGVRHVERSKIYVDVPAIKRSFDKAHRETFQRYIGLVKAGIGLNGPDIEKNLGLALSGRTVSHQALEVPKNEANELLISMVRWIFVECTGNPEHGLDCYLSMRIRHGTLSGQLRTPLEVEKLITQRAAGTDEYESNQHWEKRLAHLPDTTVARLNDCLAQFSARYDAFIANLASELIQIKTTAKPEGLFNVNLKSVRFLLWIADLRSDMSFEAFFDRLIELFWASVDDSLTMVRGTIDGQLKPEITQMFTALEASIKSAAPGVSTSDLDRAVRTAQTGTLQALDIVKDWFKLSQPISEPEFPIQDLIDVGLQCVTTIHRDFAPDVSRRVAPLPPIANALVLFSDIFFILFDNIRRHSANGPNVKVDIVVEDKGDRLRIVTRNEIGESARSADAVDRISKIKKTILDGAYQKAVTSEGGTGLIKLRRLIGNSEAGKRRLDFGFEDLHFFVELELSKREIEF